MVTRTTRQKVQLAGAICAIISSVCSAIVILFCILLAAAFLPRELGASTLAHVFLWIIFAFAILSIIFGGILCKRNAKRGYLITELVFFVLNVAFWLFCSITSGVGIIPMIMLPLATMVLLACAVGIKDVSTNVNNNNFNSYYSNGQPNYNNQQGYYNQLDNYNNQQGNYNQPNNYSYQQGIFDQPKNINNQGNYNQSNNYSNYCGNHNESDNDNNQQNS